MQFSATSILTSWLCIAYNLHVTIVWQHTEPGKFLKFYALLGL